MSKAVIVIDLQKCFLPGNPKGSLATTNNRNTRYNNKYSFNKTGYTFLGKNINTFIQKTLESNSDQLFISLDWHPVDHTSFITEDLITQGKVAVIYEPKILKNVTSNKAKSQLSTHFTSFEKYKLEDIKPTRIWIEPKDLLRQTLWPPHCVQNSPDVLLDESLKIENLETELEKKNIKTRYILKGFDKDTDSYSIVADALGNTTPYEYKGRYNELKENIKDDNKHGDHFLSILEQSDINEVYLTGIARNVCVYWSALDLLNYWILPKYVNEGQTIKLFFMYDLTRPVFSKGYDKYDILPQTIINKVKYLIGKYMKTTDLNSINEIYNNIFEVVTDEYNNSSISGGYKKCKICNKTINYFKKQKNKLVNKNSINNNNTLIKLEKQESILQNKSEKCKKTKCSKLYKEKIEEDKHFEKEQDKQCPKKLSDDEFYKCSELFYNNHPELKLKYNSFVKCGTIKCKHITKKRKEVSNKIQEHYMSKSGFKKSRTQISF